MTRPCSKNRYSLISSLLLLALIPWQSFAAELPLRAFNATYDLFQGGMHIGEAELSLKRSGDQWRWRMQSRSRGIYSLFISKQPFTETTFAQERDEIRLQQILIGDSKNEMPRETALFDWANSALRVERRGKQRQIELTTGVYDYQSIHLLAAIMIQQQQDKQTVDFYRKGSLVKSRLVYGGKGKVSIDGKDIGANIFEQIIVRSNSKLKYYYDAENPLLPLRIEKLESGESPTVLSLLKVEWLL